MPPTTMRAIRVHRPGGAEVLTYEEVPRPVPGRGEVLVAVHAAGVNPPDLYARSGYAAVPEEHRPAQQFPYIPGSDISGVVVATGDDAGSYLVGDEVFGLVRFPSRGIGGQGYSEYVTAPVAQLARKPVSIDHLQAAGAPMAGLTAFQFLVDHIGLQADASVLVNGAAGGVGHLVVQLAKAFGARVVAVASGSHESFLASLGADEFIDYTTTSVSATVDGMDHLIDLVGGPNAHQLQGAVRDGGTISPVVFGVYDEDDLAARQISMVPGQVHSDGAQLAELGRLMDSGLVQVTLDSAFALHGAVKAHLRAEEGHLQGKVVLQVR